MTKLLFVLNLFAVTLDYKALLLLLQKGDDKEFILGGKGHGEFCSYCDAIRVSTVTSMITMLLYTCNDLELNVIEHIPAAVQYQGTVKGM